MSVHVDAVDLFDPELFRDGPPHEVFDRLRREEPVFWNAREGDPDGGFWALTRYADVVRVSRDPATFTSSLGFSAPREVPANPAFAENIMYRDPPDHTRHRKPLNRAFTPRAMADLEQQVRAIAVQILDQVSTMDRFDWVPDVAAQLPARVVASVIGVPEVDHGRLVEWASAIFGRDGSAEASARFNTAVAGIMSYAEQLKTEKRSCPADDVMSALLEARVDGAPLSETALSMWFLTLAQAGFETTHTLIAQGMLLLSDRPEWRERMSVDDDVIPRVVEEMLRFVTPVNMMARTAVEDVELDGATMRAGQYVTMWYCATNRDPEVFDAPHEFDPDRSPNNHQAFGALGSPHYCLGAHLARLEMRVLLEELARRRFPFEVAGPAERVPGVFMNALACLPMVRAGGQP
jgi:cholest-4-en-3-one 26-monooxygenase